MKIWNQAQQGTFIHPQIHQLLEVEHGMKEIKVSKSHIKLFHIFVASFIFFLNFGYINAMYFQIQ